MLDLTCSPDKKELTVSKRRMLQQDDLNLDHPDVKTCLMINHYHKPYKSSQEIIIFKVTRTFLTTEEESIILFHWIDSVVALK